MGGYDTTIRTIHNEGCSALLGELGVPATVKPLPVGLPRVMAREVDLVARETATGVIQHVEFQVGHDPFMNARMLIYARQIGESVMKDEIARLRKVRKLHVAKYRGVGFSEISSTLVYIGRDRMAMLTWIAIKALKFGYAAIDIRSLETDAVLASSAVGDSIMAGLCKGGWVS